MKNDIGYHAYLLRIWKVINNDSMSWRVSLEDPHTHEILVFEDTNAFYKYIQVVIGGLSENTRP